VTWRYGTTRASHPPCATRRRTTITSGGGALPNLDRYHTIFVDSITELSRLSHHWAEQQPEVFLERTGKKDVRGAYGLHAREQICFLQQLQHVRGKNVIFVGVQEKIVDDFNVATWELQMEGKRTGRELPGIIDELITMQWIDFGDKKPIRAFICTQPNIWNYPGKDRSGRLDQIEEPHLGRLIAKLTAPGQRASASVKTEPATQVEEHAAA
jgi:hypothetical protein